MRGATRPFSGVASSELHKGTVTFLFTDIEGSTRLLGEVGAQAYDEVLSLHRRLLREAFSRHDGVEVDTQGDAFFYAFPTAPGAVEAAREGQEGSVQGLSGCAWVCTRGRRTWAKRATWARMCTAPRGSRAAPMVAKWCFLPRLLR